MKKHYWQVKNNKFVWYLRQRINNKRLDKEGILSN